MSDRYIRKGGKVFRDPIHRLIRVDRDDKFILELVDTPEFQRLRRVRQLGVSSMTYPGAEHSRFVHSLGVFAFAQRIIEVLLDRHRGEEIAKFLKEHQRVVKAAALLHDVGHGPFSHMIERSLGKFADHESKTSELIKDEEGGIAAVLITHGVDPEAVADIIDHTCEHRLLVDIVSSQLDADRMDYLLRDSHATGVEYGSFDAEWLLNAMCVAFDPEDGETRRLALDAGRGRRAAEQFILARSNMNAQVYFHRVTRGFESMLLVLFRLVAKEANNGSVPPSTPDVLQKFLREEPLSRDEWLRFDEAMFTEAFHNWSQAELGTEPRVSRLSRAFLERRREFLAVNIGSLSPMEVGRLVLALGSESLHENIDWVVDDINSSVYKGVWDAASKPNKGDASVESILLGDSEAIEQAEPIELHSGLLHHLEQQRDTVTRMYFDSAETNRFAPILNKFKLTHRTRGDQP